MSTRSWDENDRREVDRWLREVESIERASLRERKEAAATFLKDLLESPDVIAERVGWLLDGSYGRGSYLKAQQVLESPRMNRVAALTLMTAQAEWKTPSRLAVAAWKKLSPGQQEHLRRLVEREIDEAEESGRDPHRRTARRRRR